MSCVESQTSGAPAMSGGALVNLDVHVNGSMQHGRAFLTLDALRKMSEAWVGRVWPAIRVPAVRLSPWPAHVEAADKGAALYKQHRNAIEEWLDPIRSFGGIGGGK